ncbi:MAG: HAMP domain-containing sensor histidine kinase [Hyphomicrobiaceae bacterium]|nr:HAMP domain-containing sensor histidine kinase [Hyphomicrobiaceae bacterium]
MPSFVASAEGEPAPDQLAAAVRFLAMRGVCSMAWLDDELRTKACFGPLATGIVPGLPIARSVVALLGLEDEIKALRNTQNGVVAVPGVRMGSPSGDDDRLDLNVFWMPPEQHYLLLISRTSPDEDARQGEFLAESRLRRMAEAEVAAQAEIIRRTNRELAAANQDLEEFAQVISHDLRAPLRGVRYAVSDAQAALVSSAAVTASEHLTQALAHTRRMSAMLTGLLDYARLERKADAVSLVDTRTLVDEIVAASREGGRHEISVEGVWPTIATLAQPFDIVLRNIVDNAVKHHDREAGGHIVVRCVAGAGRELEITVADDGPGIDPAWHEAIFEPFKQIAETNGTAGAGIGLALVKKTIERFGGGIAVKSDPAKERGTTFVVRWPAEIEP